MFLRDGLGIFMINNFNNMFHKMNFKITVSFLGTFLGIFLLVNGSAFAQEQSANAFTVQLATLNSQTDAQSVRDAMRQAGYTAYIVESNGAYNLRVGHFLNPEAAQQYAIALQATSSFQDDFAKNFETGFGTSFQATPAIAEQMVSLMVRL